MLPYFILCSLETSLHWLWPSHTFPGFSSFMKACVRFHNCLNIVSFRTTYPASYARYPISSLSSGWVLASLDYNCISFLLLCLGKQFSGQVLWYTGERLHAWSLLLSRLLTFKHAYIISLLKIWCIFILHMLRLYCFQFYLIFKIKYAYCT